VKRSRNTLSLRLSVAAWCAGQVRLRNGELRLARPALAWWATSERCCVQGYTALAQCLSATAGYITAAGATTATQTMCPAVRAAPSTPSTHTHGCSLQRAAQGKYSLVGASVCVNCAAGSYGATAPMAVSTCTGACSRADASLCVQFSQRSHRCVQACALREGTVSPPRSRPLPARSAATDPRR